MDLKLAGKIVLVTGSSRGIGLAAAKAFADEGCPLMLRGARRATCGGGKKLRVTGAQVVAHAADVGMPRKPPR